MSSKYIARFEKVSFEQYLKDRMKVDNVTEDSSNFENEYKPHIFEVWKNIKLPMRATTGAAGYDFYNPESIRISDEPQIIPTGICAKIEEDYALFLLPRSGHAFKYGCCLDNTMGVVDSDYYFADNEGHIMAKIHSMIPFALDGGERFIQGIFWQYGRAENGNANAVRTGGFGSTGTK